MEQIFKTKAFGGFDKKDVVNCINHYYEQNAALTQQLAALQKQTDDKQAELLAAIQELQGKSAKYAAIIDEMQIILQQKQQNEARLQQENGRLAEIAKRQEQCLLEMERENKALKQQNDQANERLANQKEELSVLQEKSAGYDKFKNRQKEIQHKLNEFIARARTKADEIIQTAKREGEAITAQAKEKAQCYYKETEQMEACFTQLKENHMHVMALLEQQTSALRCVQEQFSETDAVTPPEAAGHAACE